MSAAHTEERNQGPAGGKIPDEIQLVNRKFEGGNIMRR
jgi:hypothetical protein